MVGNDAVVLKVANHPGMRYLDTVAELSEALGTVRGFVSGPRPVRAVRANGEGVAFVPAAFPNASAYPLRTDIWLWDDYDFDPARYAASTVFNIAVPVCDVEIWNPATGERRPAGHRRSGETTDVLVDFAGAPAVFLAWREGADDGPETLDAVAIPALPSSTAPSDEGWIGELVPTMDNTWGDFARPPSGDPQLLEIWSMDWVEGEDSESVAGSWSPIKVTFGEEALTCGPVAATERGGRSAAGRGADRVTRRS